MAAPVVDGDITNRLAHIIVNERKLTELEKKLSQLQKTISNSYFDPTMDALSKQFVDITTEDVKLNTFIKCFISNEGFIRWKETFENIFENLATPMQFKILACRLATLTSMVNACDQEQVLKRFLNLISVARIKEIAPIPPATFNSSLLTRIKADDLAFSFLAHYVPPSGIFKEAKSVWKICIEDIDNFLESFDILTKTPITGMEAQSFFQAYQLPMLFLAETTKGVALSIGIPFAFNALRKLYKHYAANTPSSLPPLVEFSDPNFYQCVAPITNRDSILNQIQQAWGDRVTPILVGEPGCGKTSILIEVARRIDQGLFFKSHKGAYKAFGGSAIALANAGGTWGANDHIRKTLTKVADKRDFTVLLLDEVEGFDKDQKLLLRSFFDGLPQSIRFGVLAVTTAGKNAFFENDDNSLGRRFRVIDVPDFTPDETKIALYRQAHSMAPAFNIAPNVMTRIITKANGKLAQSTKILCKILRKVMDQNCNCPSQDAFKNKVNEIKLAQSAHVTQLKVNPNGAQQTADRLEQLENEKIALLNKLETEQTLIKNHAFLLAKRTLLTYRIVDISQALLRSFNEHLHTKRQRLDQLSSADAIAYFSEAPFQLKIASQVKEYAYYNFVIQGCMSEQIQEFEREHRFVSEINDEFVSEDDLVVV